MKAFLINLKNRPDRLNNSVNQLINLKLAYIRVEAVSDSLIEPSDCRYLPSGVVAIWKSHQRAMSKFIETDDEFALILEDDFIIRGSFDLNQLGKLLDSKFDFIQVGYLNPTYEEKLSDFYFNFKDLTLKYFAKLHKIFFISRLEKFNKLLINEQSGVPRNLVLNNIRPGAHAYVISRNFALAMQNLNNPTFLSTDLLYMSIGTLRSFRMARFRKSQIDQDGTPSSITQRFINLNY